MPECGYCKDCRWWGSRTDEESSDSRFCGNDELKASTNWEGLEADSDFGCVQWEVKQ